MKLWYSWLCWGFYVLLILSGRYWFQFGSFIVTWQDEKFKTGSICFNIPLYQVNDGNKSLYIFISSVILHYSDYDSFKSVFSYHIKQIEVSIEILQVNIMSKGNNAIIGRTTRPLKPSNMTFSFWTTSPSEASKD